MSDVETVSMSIDRPPPKRSLGVTTNLLVSSGQFVVWLTCLGSSVTVFVWAMQTSVMGNTSMRSNLVVFDTCYMPWFLCSFFLFIRWRFPKHVFRCCPDDRAFQKEIWSSEPLTQSLDPVLRLRLFQRQLSEGEKFLCVVLVCCGCSRSIMNDLTLMQHVLMLFK